MAAQPSVRAVSVIRASLPLDRPYPVAMATLTELDAIISRIEADDGSVGWGEVTIIPGYTHETVESGLALCLAHAPRLLRKTAMQGKRHLLPYVATEPHAVSALMTALEMLERHWLLVPEETRRIEVLAPVRGLEAAKIPEEVESLIAKGHRTLKVKVGFKSVLEDLARLRMIANAAFGAAKLRVDANQGYTQEEGSRFARELDPAVVELFEQPCDKHDWDSNAAVAAVSSVPVMLDESVYNFADIQRAAGIEGVGYIKIEMEKFGGVEMAKTGLEMIRACGMIPVAGNGAASDISSWMEACTARLTVDVPCEMHGFLKLKTPLLQDRLPFVDGAIVLAPGYFPRVDEGAVARCTTFSQRFE
ncbi:MAG TPA: enolase C-terminal domain-like protein [Casimicrobiaceae bacterium]|jgi:L-alanine-DL-glutamate epimerase-like enolase superfamily enzyme|nr:enolase C-terminal domain-like protein [Casimicrobiaceae bacterium]